MATPGHYLRRTTVRPSANTPHPLRKFAPAPAGAQAWDEEMTKVACGVTCTMSPASGGMTPEG
jgi:hypothetical protein